MFTEKNNATVAIAGEEYELLLTTAATYKITQLQEKLKDGDTSSQFEVVLEILTVLINQSIKRHNYEKPDDKKQELTVDYIGLYTAPYEITEFKSAIDEAIKLGMNRNVLSAGEGDDEKNTKAE